jgi:hypothetical protein
MSTIESLLPAIKSRPPTSGRARRRAGWSKAYFNLGNPDWLLSKVADSTRTTLKLQPKAHF